MQRIIFYINIFLAVLACTTLTTVNCGPITTNDKTLKQTNALNILEQSKNVIEDFSAGSARMPRFTCDFFSAEFEGISIANGMCLAKCATQRRLGGSCQNGLCVCSDKSF